MKHGTNLRPGTPRRLAWPVLAMIALICILVASPLAGHIWKASALDPFLESTGDLPRLPLRHVPAGPAQFVPGRLMVKFRSDLPLAQRRAHLAARPRSQYKSGGLFRHGDNEGGQDLLCL